MEAPAILLLALLLDRALGEPPDRVHPTVLMGRMCSLLTRRLPRTLGGGLVLLLLVTLTFSALTLLLLSLIPWTPLKVAVAAAALKLSLSWRGLGEYALRVKRDLERGDLTAARGNIRYLVSRNPERLDRGRLCSACVESIAENIVDAVAAPLFYFALFSTISPELGVAAAVAYRAVNTLDAMV
ncbi:MAG: cobalamin biosynthesis protein CobD, partial [Euryarchaeota archaeon]|nr:cobalamin biosynthesis protein CobD [Euryarchaeota archaeon]